MASLWRRDKSRFWYACWTDEDGRRWKRSTKTTNRRDAQRLADTLEEAGRRLISRGQAHRMLAEVFDDAGGSATTVEKFALGWLVDIKPTVSGSTFSSYKKGVAHWLEVMGERAGIPLLQLSRHDIIRYRNALAAGHPVTGNQRLKLVKMVLKSAREAGLAFDDPFAGVKPLKGERGEETARRPFTIPELQRLLTVADAEWRSLVRFGIYTGQRLGDLAALRWNQIDTARGEITLITKKTGRRMAIPINSALGEHLAAMPASDDPKAFLHPRAAALVKGAKGKVSTLSRHFGELLESAGLRTVEESTPENPAGHARRDKRAGRRTLAELSFHSLRHTARSLLEAAGVPLKTAMDLLGHSDIGTSMGYTHVDSETLRRAAESLPRF